MNRSSDHDCSWTFGCHFCIPQWWPHPCLLAATSGHCEKSDWFHAHEECYLSLSLEDRLEKAGEGRPVEEPVWWAGQGPPQDCLVCGMKLVRRWVTILVADRRERTGDLSCSLEPPLQPRVLNCSLYPVWVRVIALSMSSPSWLTSFTGFTFIRECPRGRSNTQVPAWALGSSSLPDRRARLWKFWRNPLLNRCGECWAAEG